MRVFVYEYVTGGGLWHEATNQPHRSLLAEGDAMLQAVARDFASLDSVKVSVLRDVRLQPLAIVDCAIVPVASASAESEALAKLALAADWTLLIAPETNGVLLDRCRTVESAGGRLLSPSAACVELASNKHATADALRRHGVPTPRGMLLRGDQRLPADFPFPAVAKPIDGCGSQGVRLIRRADDIQEIEDPLFVRIEEFIPGLAASVAAICGLAGNCALPACEQRLSRNGRFTYLGGRLPLPPQLDERARRLALAAVNALPQPRGYIGVDLVLGEDADGSGDRVIEINPRLTTSYIGLRSLSRTNLASAMLAVTAGRAPDLCFGAGPIEFTAER
jgi:tyramine---L-glutamate ligase